MWQFNLLHHNFTKIRAELAEAVAQQIATEKFNMIVRRPGRIIQMLESNSDNDVILGTPEFRFLKKYQKTMDFFAIWPKKHPNLPKLSEIDLIEHFFSHSGLLRYAKPIPFHGFALEVKSFQVKQDSQFFDNSLQLSDNQLKMASEIENIPHLDLMFAKVGFWGKYNITIKFLSIKRNVISPRDFVLS